MDGRALIFCCVKWGDRYSAEYVNILRDMIGRNLPDGLAGQFRCYTDDPAGLAPEVMAVPLPEGIRGWWNKLALFRSEVFPDNARVIYFDLDTVIGGRLDDLLSFEGDFGILRDFYRPDGYGSGVMLWRGGVGSHIWDAWEASGRPEFPGGDQEWIELVHPGAVRLQDVYPRLFCSFKADCHPYPPKGAHVICFHGEPKPHNCAIPWVGDVWKVGGAIGFDLEVICNTADDRLRANTEAACALDLPWLSISEPHEGHAVIIGGGPSLAQSMGEIARRAALGQTLFACNGVFSMLMAHRIKPEIVVVCDARPESRIFADAVAGRGVSLLLASQCAPETFEDAAGKEVVIYHPNNGIAQPIAEQDRTGKPINLIGGGSTVGLQAMACAYVMGFRIFHLYGMDSSYQGRHGHAYPQALNDADRQIECECEGRKFTAAPWMITQVEEFQTFAAELRDLGCTITVHGDGLLPHVAHIMAGTKPLSREPAHRLPMAS